MTNYVLKSRKTYQENDLYATTVENVSHLLQDDEKDEESSRQQQQFQPSQSSTTYNPS